MTDRRCEEIQEILATAGAPALQQDEDAQRHLADCDACYAVLEGLAQLDDALAALPPLDAPDSLVEQTLGAVRADVERAAESPAALDPATAGAADAVTAQTDPGAAGTRSTNGQGAASTAGASRGVRARPVQRWLSRHRSAAAAAAATAAFAALFSTQLFDRLSRDAWVGVVPSESEAVSPEAETVAGKLDRDWSGRQRAHDLAAESPAPYPLARPGQLEDAEGSSAFSGIAGAFGDESAPQVAQVMPEPKKEQRNEVGSRESHRRSESPTRHLDLSLDDALGEEIGLRSERDAVVDALEPSVAIAIKVAKRSDAPVEHAGAGVADAAGSAGGKGKDARLEQARGRAASGLAEREDESLRALGYLSDEPKPATLEAAPKNAPDAQSIGRSQTAPTDAARRVREFEAARRAIDGVPTQQASGYWANTYVPGDPTMRWLEARLLGQGATALEAIAGTPVALAAASRPPLQPFDRPSTAALDVFVSADRASLEDRGRAIVQVGIQASERHPGGRPAMNLSLVLDARSDVPPATRDAMRALLTSFSQARDEGDHFSLTFAGRPGAPMVAGDAFRYGPLSIAVDEAFELAAQGSVGSLEPALRRAVAEARDGGEDRTLGASGVVIVTDRPFGAELDALVELAHRSALDGVFVSVIAIGRDASPREVEAVTLAGQGRRHLLDAPADADRVVLQELRGLSRLVARAVRLRIRLAPGVELVDVLGSERLDDGRAERVREAERSVDTRLARELGIEADRGEDEDGIQIVIPAFYAGDSHVVLLDIIAPGPGPIADVTARFKDIAMQRNGTARASLALADREVVAGPLEQNVVANLLAHRLGETLERSGALVLAGEDYAAAALIDEFRSLLLALQAEGVGGSRDDLARDTAMLDDYLSAIRAGSQLDGTTKRQLADSLRLAAYWKTQARSSR